MSSTSDSSGKRHAFPWLSLPVALIVVVVLYVSTWPVVEVWVGRRGMPTPLTRDLDRPAIRLAIVPSWLTRFYKPLHLLADLRIGGRAFLLDYWLWCSASVGALKGEGTIVPEWILDPSEIE
ncbi:hypothetical protein AYO49_05375 [Verrucomicrobiaceae bacterium SCGC AG-212-N21]|nr:hypothetical protein AYO49_05375 [Verrucomicrobiaceae bacterium SCGC AG-212-N21]